MKVKKITKPELDGDTYLIAQAVNHNAEVLEDVLNKIKALEKQPFKNAYKQVVKERDIAIEQLNELGYSWGEKIRPREKEQESVLDKIRAEIDRQGKWLSQAGYNVYNVDIAFSAIKRVMEGKE